MVIDTGLDSDTARQLVAPGDRIVIDQAPCSLLGDRMASPALDDRSGVAAILRSLELVQGKRLDCSLTVVFSVREEVNGAGAAVSAFTAAPDEAVSYTHLIYLYGCRVDKMGQTNPDEDEFVEVEAIPLDRAVEMVLHNEIPDAKTQVLVLKTDAVSYTHLDVYKRQECVRLNQEGINSPLAIETSGHAALRENYYLDDGAYLITRIIIEMARLGKEGKQLDDLIAGLQEPAEATELRFPILDPDFASYGQKVIQSLEVYAKEKKWAVAPDNFEGIRVSFGRGEGDGWFLLRLSVHDPIMPLNIESDVTGGVRIIRCV